MRFESCMLLGGRLRCRRRGSARVKNLEGAFIVFFFKLNWFGSVRFFRFQAYQTEAEPNRLVFKNSNQFNRFFFTVRFFRLFFSVFSV